MNHIRTVSLVFLYVFLLAATHSAAVTPSDAAKWRTDLRFLADQIREIHPNAFHSLSEKEFVKNVAELDRRIPNLERHEIIVGLKRIIASIDDGHSSLPLVFSFHGMTSKTGFRELPIKLYLFDDGVFVTEAGQKYGGLVGKRIIKIGNLPVAEVLERVAVLVSKDNEMTAKERLPSLLIIPEVLHALKITDDIDVVPIEVDADGSSKRFDVSPQKRKDNHAWKTASTGAAPMWLKKYRDPYWFEYLKETKTVFFQYNVVENRKSGDSLKLFFSKMFEFIEKNDVDKLVIDLRHNTGGNGVRNWNLIYGIIRSDKINRKGKLFVITGRKTFSAATHAAVLLDSHTNSIIVGEPSSGNINSYGDHKPFTLPNSGILAFVSKYYHQNTYPWDKRKMLKPKLEIPVLFEDFRKNKDAALDSIMSYKAE